MKVKLNGCTRIVFVFDRFVIKVPNFTYSWLHFLTGLVGNIKERDTWNAFVVTGKSHLLCPVVWMSWGGWILVMKRAEVLDWDTEPESYDEFIEADLKDDLKPQNFGIYNNRIVKIDYA